MLWFSIKHLLVSSSSFWNFWFECLQCLGVALNNFFNFTKYEIWKSGRLWKFLHWMAFFSSFFFRKNLYYRFLTRSYPLYLFGVFLVCIQSECEKIRTIKTPNTTFFMQWPKPLFFQKWPKKDSDVSSDMSKFSRIISRRWSVWCFYHPLPNQIGLIKLTCE